MITKVYINDLYVHTVDTYILNTYIKTLQYQTKLL